MIEYNVYCDETCHLEHDNHKYMIIGAVYCPKDKVRDINNRLYEIKTNGKLSKFQELKWTKVSNSNRDVVKNIIYKFFDDDDLHFRAIIINKDKLDFKKYNNQDFKSFYYVAYYEMLKVIFEPSSYYNIYLDIKDTNSQQRINILQQCLNNYINKTYCKNLIKKVQHVKSHEVQIMQITDLLIGAIAYDYQYNKKNKTKEEIINIIKNSSGYDFKQTTLLREQKFNLLLFNEGKQYDFKNLQ